MRAELLFAEAQSNLDQNRFREASDLYRQAATICEPTQTQLGNLSLAEAEDRVQSRRELCSRYPTSLNCKLSLIQALDSAGHSNLAVQRASEALLADDLAQNEQLLLRLVRLKSAVASATCKLVLEDFVHVWNAGEHNVAAFRCRKGVLTSLLGCSDTRCVDTFEELSALPCVDELVANLFKTKAEELRLMRSVLGQDTQR